MKAEAPREQEEVVPAEPLQTESEALYTKVRSMLSRTPECREAADKVLFTRNRPENPILVRRGEKLYSLRITRGRIHIERRGGPKVDNDIGSVLTIADPTLSLNVGPPSESDPGNTESDPADVRNFINQMKADIAIGTTSAEKEPSQSNPSRHGYMLE
ncbi:hypothetical protein CMO96_02845 [Candidatus Woesebacteria bacterium]|nr:hypothetical protein [Candidatus Woesebacteria bacterium]